MPEFISEPVEVVGEGATPQAFVWRGETKRVVAVEEEWQDYGFGATHPAARSWRTRRHRNCFRILASDGHRYELYLDRGSGERRWYLYRRLD
jgi:hypothetical protein